LVKIYVKNSSAYHLVVQILATAVRHSSKWH